MEELERTRKILYVTRIQLANALARSAELEAVIMESSPVSEETPVQV